MTRSTGSRLIVLLCVGALGYLAYQGIMYSPLALLLGREPRHRVALSDITNATGWKLSPRTRLVHSQGRSWLDETIIAELEMPEQDADALLRQLQQQQRQGHLQEADVKIPEPPYWWKPIPTSPHDVVAFWTSAPHHPQIGVGFCIAQRSGGMARTYVLWIAG